MLSVGMNLFQVGYFRLPAYGSEINAQCTKNDKLSIQEKPQQSSSHNGLQNMKTKQIDTIYTRLGAVMTEVLI